MTPTPISPYVFAGLRADMHPLYKTLQLFINENGGRLKLAHTLENEMLHTFRASTSYKRDGGVKWTEYEKLYIKSNRHMSAKDIALDINRTTQSVYQAVYRMILNGELTSKRNII